MYFQNGTFSDSLLFVGINFSLSRNTGSNKKSECWHTIIPSTLDTVDKFGHRALCKDIVLQVAAIMDYVELGRWVVVVEAEWLV